MCVCVCVCVCVCWGGLGFVVIVVYFFVCFLYVCLLVHFHLYKQNDFAEAATILDLQKRPPEYISAGDTTLHYTILHYTIAAGFPFSRSGGYKKERDGRTERNWCPPNGYG